MDGLVKLIWAFWIIVIIGIIVAVVVYYWWILIPVGIIAVIAIPTTIVNYKKKKKKETEENKRKAEKQLFLENLNRQEENRQNEEATKGKKYLEENSGKLNEIIGKYYQSVYNFVENITETSHDVFANVDTKFPDTPNDTNILISPYWQSASPLLKSKFKHDGFGFSNYDTVIRNGYIEAEKLQNLTKFFIVGLKKRIVEQDEWTDEYTLPIVLYMVIRNNVIKYHHDLYVEEVGFENIEDYCR